MRPNARPMAAGSSDLGRSAATSTTWFSTSAWLRAETQRSCVFSARTVAGQNPLRHGVKPDAPRRARERISRLLGAVEPRTTKTGNGMSMELASAGLKGPERDSNARKKSAPPAGSRVESTREAHARMSAEVHASPTMMPAEGRGSSSRTTETGRRPPVSFKEDVPLHWILFRFLCHFVRTNSICNLSGINGQVLTTTNYKDYLGHELPEKTADEMLRVVLGSWVRVFPEKSISLCDIYASTDMTIDQLKRSINSLRFSNHIEETEKDLYKIKPSIFDNSFLSKGVFSLDRIANRYYQEIRIQATEPFCFVIMPFKEEEFPQRIYTEVIKPFVEDRFEIACYRVDEDNLPDRIDNKIYTYLLRSAFVIAEVTTFNPNVLYELGLAHMLEKDCIILSNKPISQIPFDISRIRSEHYDNDEQLTTILERSISVLAFKGK